MKKQIILCFILAASAGGASAVDVGLGVSMDLSNNESRTISVPVKVLKNFLVEPYYREEGFEYERSDPFLHGHKFKRSELGAGLFYSTEHQEGISVYVGARVGYLDNNFSIEDNADNFEEYEYGYSVSPTLALQYEVMSKLVVSGEIDWAFSRLEGKVSSIAGIVDSSTEKRETGSRIFVRYFF
jgi:hypothetical protein